MIQERHPAVAQSLLQQLETPGDHTGPSAHAALAAVAHLAAVGLQAPSFSQLAEGLRPPQYAEELPEVGDFFRGWQRVASPLVERA